MQAIAFPIFIANPDLSVFVGGRGSRHYFGYRKNPFSSRHSFNAGLAVNRLKPSISYTGTFRQLLSDLDVRIHLKYSGLQVIRFNGFGNATEIPRPFSLAGIVAAVRFRTSLEEPMDAVYMFMAIGIGLAAGTQLTTVAYLASLVFVAIALGVWKSNFGARPAVISGWTIVYPDKAAQVSETSDPAIATQKPRDAQIEVHATNIEEVQKATDLILNSNTKRWQVADVIHNEDGTVVVMFDVWLKKSVNPLSLVRDIEESGKGSINEVRMRGNNS